MTEKCVAEGTRSNWQHLLNHGESKAIQEKCLLVLH